MACASAEEAILGAGIITTSTADKRNATILTDNMVGAGRAPERGRRRLPRQDRTGARTSCERATIFVEFPPQTRIEGEIQQLPPDHPVTELWQVLTGAAAGRTSAADVTLFDSVGFAIEDFSALRYVRRAALDTGLYAELDMLADPDDPRDLYGMVMRAAP